MRRQALSPKERVDWLRLSRTSGVGPVTFAKLIERFQTASNAIDNLADLSKRGGRAKPLKALSREQAEAELEDHDQLGARLLCACEPDFPADLAAIDPPPPVISVKGELVLKDRLICAMVGARHASAASLRFAGDLARGLGERGVVVASGLARGIDGAAHAASLETGTVAVLAGGLTSIYPPEHEALYHAIAEQGLLVSETPLRYSPQARDFPRRNRLISGLSLGVLVVEAAERSGSLITARYGLEQNREVMAVPGSPMDPRARGSNRLLQDGAALVQGVEDVLAVLSGARRSSLQEPGGSEFEDEYDDADALNEAVEDIRERIAALLSPTPVSRDELARLTKSPARVVLAALVELELAGRCEIWPNGMVCSAYQP